MRLFRDGGGICDRRGDPGLKEVEYDSDTSGAWVATTSSTIVKGEREQRDKMGSLLKVKREEQGDL